jgi:CubicO group peptidase (beta-lactamase class C family)
MVNVQGTVRPGFESVRTAFEANFEQFGEVGAAVAVYCKGNLVADLWGGLADKDTGRAWERDTTALVFSTTKGPTAVCANLLAERGELDLDAPVVKYWPEFGKEGKATIPVRWLLSHKAGLAVVDRKLSFEDVLAWEPVIHALEAQAPVWEPGTAQGYHALTYGYLVGEVVRRVSGVSIGAFFAKEVAAPLGLDFHIGLPSSEEARVSRLVPMVMPTEGPTAMPPDSLMSRALNLGGAIPVDGFNDPRLHAAEMPAANGIGTARSIAKMYAALIGEVDGVRILRPETVEAARQTESQGPDKVLMIETRFGRGFMLHSPFTPIGGTASFGHPGAGGSIGWADPEAGMSFAYVMNQMQMNLAGDPRMFGLLQAAYASL